MKPRNGQSYDFMLFAIEQTLVGASPEQIADEWMTARYGTAEEDLKNLHNEATGDSQ